MIERTTPFQTGETVEYFRRVVESPTQLGQIGKVVGFRFPEEVSVFGPIVIYVDLGAGVEVAFHADELRRVPPTAQDHGPLGAVLSDRTLTKVLSRPAYVPRDTPSLVELDAKEAVLAAALAWDVAMAGDGSTLDAAEDAVRDAIREYREVTS